MWLLSKRLEGIRKNSSWIIQRIFCFLYKVSCSASSSTTVATVSKRILWTYKGANTGNSCDIFCHHCGVSEPRRAEVFPKGAVSLWFRQPMPVVLLKRICFFHFQACIFTLLFLLFLLTMLVCLSAEIILDYLFHLLYFQK